MLQAGQLAFQQSQQQLGAITIRQIGRVDQCPNDQALRIHQYMAFPPIDFLPAIIAPGAPHNRGLD